MEGNNPTTRTKVEILWSFTSTLKNTGATITLPTTYFSSNHVLSSTWHSSLFVRCISSSPSTFYTAKPSRSSSAITLTILREGQATNYEVPHYTHSPTYFLQLTQPIILSSALSDTATRTKQNMLLQWNYVFNWRHTAFDRCSLTHHVGLKLH
jgi:hypothetical protein